MKFALLFTLVASFTMCHAVRADDKEKEYPPVLDFKMQTLDGEEVVLGEKYAGKVVLFVNVASKCGYTPQYAGLQKLHDKYAEQGLAIVGVPCNQFGKQEPGSAKQIAEFCDQEYGVEFDMLAKVNVRADQEKQAPLFAYLTSEETNPKHGGDIKWNFEKFLVSRSGEVVGHYASKVAPESDELIEAIETEIGKPAPEKAPAAK